MGSSRDRNWVLESVRQACSPARPITQELLENNLRWIMQLAYPGAVAPGALRRRVQTRISYTEARQRLGRRPAPRRRRGLIRRATWGGWLSDPILEQGIAGGPEQDPAESEQELLHLLLVSEVSHLLHHHEVLEAVGPLVRRCLITLPEMEREALQLQLVHELSMPEIALVMGESERETGRLLLEARRALFGHWWQQIKEH